MNTNSNLKRAIDDAAGILAKAKAIVGISTDASNNTSSNNDQQQLQQKQKVLDIGRLTEIYENCIDIVTNYLPNVRRIDLERYPKDYSSMEDDANKESRSMKT